jgi:hypothetical protein
MGERPFFVIGYPRSGTTLLQCMLNAHPRLAVPPETRFLLPTYTDRLRFGDLHEPANRALLATAIIDRPEAHSGDLGLSPATIRQAINAAQPTLGSVYDAVFSAFATSSGKERWGDKHPRYSMHVGSLLQLFPDAQIIHLVRDPRDSVESLLRMPWYHRAADHAIWTWAAVVDEGDRLSRRLGPQRYLELGYEQLVEDPELSLRRTSAFLGEDFHPDMCHPELGTPTGLPSDRVFHKAIRSGVQSSLRGRWRSSLSPHVWSLIEYALGSRMKHKGYELEGARAPSPGGKWRYRRIEAERNYGELKIRADEARRRWQYPWPVAASGPVTVEMLLSRP